MSKEEEIDPSIYQYDEVYDEIKGTNANAKDKNKDKKDKSRSRSRDK